MVVEVGAVVTPPSQRGEIPGGKWGAGRQDGGASVRARLCCCQPALSHICEGTVPPATSCGGLDEVRSTAPGSLAGSKPSVSTIGGGVSVMCLEATLV